MKVRDLMERIRLQEIVLPEFQREYVWDVEQARQLLRSLYRAYPTGSLLFWDTTAPPATKHAAETPQFTGSQQVILDGQQRLTALYLLTQGKLPPYYGAPEVAHDPRGMFFDLLTGSFHVEQTSTAPSRVPVPECFAGDPNTFAIAQTITQGQQGDAFNGIIAQCVDHLSRLRGILDYDYPTQAVPPSATLDEAIDVFDRVNSMGTKLTAAELALTHVSGKWFDARQTMKALLHELAAKHFHFDLDFLVRGLAGVISGRTQFAELHYLPAAQVQAHWEHFAAALRYLADVLPAHAALRSTNDLSSPDVLIPLAVHVARHGGTFPHEQGMRRAIYWLYAATMWGRYTSEGDQRLDYDLAVVHRNTEPWGELVEVITEHRGRIEARASDLEGRGPEHPLFRMARVAMSAAGAADWTTNMPLASLPQLHSFPLFPLPAQLNTLDAQLQRKQADEIANQVFLMVEPSSPLLSLLPALAQQRPDVLEQHCIPHDANLWQAQHFSAFLSARRERIAAAINTRLHTFQAANIPTQPRTLDDLRMAGESVSMEYKSTLRWDVKKGGKNEELEHMVVKTIAAFLNTEGGYLLIGVEDDGNVYGIEHDFATTENGNIDWFERHLRSLISTTLGIVPHDYVHIDFEETAAGTVCIVRVLRSAQPIFCRNKKDPTTSTFYIRVGNATNMLPTTDLNWYLNNHWRS